MNCWTYNTLCSKRCNDVFFFPFLMVHCLPAEHPFLLDNSWLNSFAHNENEKFPVTYFIISIRLSRLSKPAAVLGLIRFHCAFCISRFITGLIQFSLLQRNQLWMFVYLRSWALSIITSCSMSQFLYWNASQNFCHYYSSVFANIHSKFLLPQFALVFSFLVFTLGFGFHFQLISLDCNFSQEARSLQVSQFTVIIIHSKCFFVSLCLCLMARHSKLWFTSTTNILYNKLLDVIFFTAEGCGFDEVLWCSKKKEKKTWTEGKRKINTSIHNHQNNNALFTTWIILITEQLTSWIERMCLFSSNHVKRYVYSFNVTWIRD